MGFWSKLFGKKDKKQDDNAHQETNQTSAVPAQNINPTEATEADNIELTLLEEPTEPYSTVDLIITKELGDKLRWNANTKIWDLYPQATSIFIAKDANLWDALEGHPFLETVIFEDGIQKDDLPSLTNCPSLRKVVLPADLEEVPAFAFNKLPHLEEVVLPQSVRVIEEYAFSHCTALEHISLPEGLKEIGYDVLAVVRL